MRDATSHTATYALGPGRQLIHKNAGWLAAGPGGLSEGLRDRVASPKAALSPLQHGFQERAAPEEHVDHHAMGAPYSKRQRGRRRCERSSQHSSCTSY